MVIMLESSHSIKKKTEIECFRYTSSMSFHQDLRSKNANISESYALVSYPTVFTMIPIHAFSILQ